MEVIEKLRGKTTVFFSTHIISDVERICDQVLILNNGHLELQDSLDNIKSKFAIHAIEIVIDEADVNAFVDAIKQEPWFGNVNVLGEGKLLLGFKDLAAVQKGVPALVTKLGIALKKLDTAESTLEDVFLKVVNKQ